MRTRPKGYGITMIKCMQMMCVCVQRESADFNFKQILHGAVTDQRKACFELFTLGFTSQVLSAMGVFVKGIMQLFKQRDEMLNAK
jgi:hypothetical protein